MIIQTPKRDKRNSIVHDTFSCGVLRKLAEYLQFIMGFRGLILKTRRPSVKAGMWPAEKSRCRRDLLRGMLY
jgi:hypothetical protein